MSYVELIVVLSIFAIMSSISMFSYRDFQANVEIKNLASDIASKIVEAQKSSVNGVLPPAGHNPSTPDLWKPSYGVYFDTTSVALKKQFIYFVDLYNNGTRDMLETIAIVKNNNSILDIKECNDDPCTATSTINTLSVYFKRPDSGAIFLPLTPAKYYQITVTSPQNKNAFIKIYPSGRIQVN